DRADAIVVAVRRRDVAVVVAARVEVVVVPIDSRVPQRERVVVGEQAEAGADLERQLLLDLTDRGRDLPQLALARAPATRDDAVRAGTASPGLACTVEQDVAGEQLILRDGRGRDDRLRAIAAVLGTDPALRVDQ